MIVKSGEEYRQHLMHLAMEDILSRSPRLAHTMQAFLGKYEKAGNEFAFFTIVKRLVCKSSPGLLEGFVFSETVSDKELMFRVRRAEIFWDNTLDRDLLRELLVDSERTMDEALAAYEKENPDRAALYRVLRRFILQLFVHASDVDRKCPRRR